MELSHCNCGDKTWTLVPIAKGFLSPPWRSIFIALLTRLQILSQGHVPSLWTWLYRNSRAESSYHLGCCDFVPVFWKVFLVSRNYQVLISYPSWSYISLIATRLKLISMLPLILRTEPNRRNEPRSQDLPCFSHFISHLSNCTLIIPRTIHLVLSEDNLDIFLLFTICNNLPPPHQPFILRFQNPSAL